MARGKPAAEAVVTDVRFDSNEALDSWIGQQREWFDAVLGSWTQQQQIATQAWLSWLDALSAPASAWMQAAWPAVPDNPLMAGPRLLQAWWAPWAPFLERGGEQLG
ncbi:hypothetical protein [Piscinibacter defluvii]|uniref:hypothetical protein n=1 Tax=Piscinibacter defluvii TaxID=1796922 RepID=UPI000FDD48C8|nr:hypothetical protein [Piscinibacter defluvii]